MFLSSRTDYLTSPIVNAIIGLTTAFLQERLKLLRFLPLEYVVIFFLCGHMNTVSCGPVLPPDSGRESHWKTNNIVLLKKFSLATNFIEFLGFPPQRSVVIGAPYKFTGINQQISLPTSN